MMPTVGLTLTPLDLLFFRDGRPFSSEGRAASTPLPPPQTVAGAVRTALLTAHGADFAAGRGRAAFGDFVRAACPAAEWIADVSVRGPWFRRGEHVLVPTPAGLHRRKKDDAGPLVRLSPCRTGDVPGWAGPSRPLWARGCAGPTEPAGGFLTPRGLTAFLAGGVPEPGDLVRADDLFGWDDRTGLVIDPARLAGEDGQLFGRRFLAVRGDVTLYAEVVGPPAVRDTLARVPFLALGGEGRRAAVAVLGTPHAWPGREPTGGRKRVLVLTSPGLFGGPVPPPPVRHRLAAAAVPGPVAVSGWDLARNGPRPTRFAAPAGSTYFLDDARPAPADLGSADSDLGYGAFISGEWTDE